MTDNPYRPPESTPETKTSLTPQENQPQGIGGWLILPVIGLFITPVWVAITTINEIIPSLQPEVWDILTTPGTQLYHPLWAVMIIFELVGNSILFVGSLVLIVLLFGKKKIFPRLIIAFYILNLVVLGIDYLAIVTFISDILPTEGEKLGLEAMKELAKAIIGAAIWIPYFLVSVRVKNTFVN
jgi:hypothetical protein